MTFANPSLLLLLVVPVALIAFEVLRRGRRVALPFDHGRARSGAWIARLVLAASFLPAVLLGIAIVILAGPLRSGTPKQVRELTNIEICLDVSGSMRSGFGDGSRYDAAMQAIHEFIEQRRGDAFGLTIFGNEVLRWTPLTKDLAVIAHATPFLRPEVLPRHFGGTEIGKGLRFCRDTLTEREEGDRLIILLSDGVSADLGGNIPVELGHDLAENGIVLHSIFIGNGTATQQLYDVTRPTGGEVFAVEDPAALSSVFTHIDEMQPVRLKPSASQQVDDFELAATLGLMALGLYLLTLLGLRYTPW